ncbi:MAG: hypothetical protein K0R48_395 [Gammaproteobacteria bacterium]|nr:hypothetical protein [Gammaproteobacteria bacterium]
MAVDIDMGDINNAVTKRIESAGPNAFRLSYELYLMSSLPEEGESKVRKGDIYVDPGTRQYLSRNLDGEIIRWALPHIEVEPQKINDPQLKQRIVRDSSELKRIEPNPDRARELVAEMCLQEISRYKAFCEYRDKLTSDFIIPFNTAEKVFLLDVRQRLDQVVKIQEQCIYRLLSLLDYQDLNTLAEDLIKKLPQVEIAVASEAQGDDIISKVILTVGITSDFITPYLAKRLKGAEHGFVGDKVVRVISAIRDATQDTRDLISRLAADSTPLHNMAEYYAKSTLPHHSERSKRFQPSVMPIFSGRGAAACGYDIRTYISRLVSRRQTEYVALTECIDHTWEHSSEGNVSNIVSQLWKIAATNNEQIVEMNKGYVLCLMSSLPDNDPKKAKKEKIYIEEKTRKFVVRGYDGKVYQGFLPESLKVDGYDIEMPIGLGNLSKKLENKQLKGNIVTFLCKKGHIVDELNAIGGPKPPRSVGRLSGMMGKAETLATRLHSRVLQLSQTSKKKSARENISAVSPQWSKPKPNRAVYELEDNEPADLSADVPFVEFANFVLAKIEAYNTVAETNPTENRVTGWEFIYSRDREELVNAIPQDDFKEGDSVKVFHHNHHTFTVTPENVDEDMARGVGITVHRHEQEDMHLAVQVMVEAIAKIGKKEIHISVDSSATRESEELILAYARVILAQNAIPIIKGLNREESKLKLQAIENRLKDNPQASKYFISERYSCEVARIEQIQKEDKLYLKNFDSFIQALLRESTTTTTADGAKGSSETVDMHYNATKGMITRLAKITLVDKNLTEDDFVKRIALCARTIILAARPIPDNKMHEIEKELLLELKYSLVESADISPNDLGAKLFELALARLEDDTVNELGSIDTSLSEDSTDNESKGDAFFDDSVKEDFIEEAMQESKKLEAQMNEATVYEESSKIQAQEIETEEFRGVSHKEFKQRITVLYDKRNEIGLDRRFTRALAAYALFLGEIRQEHFDLAESLIPEISLVIENAEKLLKIDEPKSSSVERKDAAKFYENLLRKASNELKLELQDKNEAIDSKGNSNLLSLCEKILVQELEEMPEAEEIVLPNSDSKDKNMTSTIPAPPPAPNLNSAFKPNAEKEKKDVSASINTLKPATDLMVEITRGTALNRVRDVESVLDSMTEDLEANTLAAELTQTLKKDGFGLKSATERKLPPARVKEKSLGEKLKEELLAVTGKRKEIEPNDKRIRPLATRYGIWSRPLPIENSCSDDGREKEGVKPR